MKAAIRQRNWVWFGVLALWTALLLTPGDWFGDSSKQKLGVIGIGKLLHVGFYFLLAATAGWLRWPLFWRLAIIPLLIIHGGLTEWLQTMVRLREGCWRDVGIDTASVLAGFAITWPWWPGAASTAATPPTADPP
jgi:hypothetical protein